MLSASADLFKELSALPVLKAVHNQSDRSSPRLSLAGKDALDDEADRWTYFFETGARNWFPLIVKRTFATTFVELSPEEAAIIVTHWEARERALTTAWPALACEASERLEPLRARLHDAVVAECSESAAGLCFVKLSTRSPKDSSRALARAELAYTARVAAAGGAASLSANARWRILSEEATRSVAVADGAAALELLLDSQRVFEDLEYALRGPPAAAAAAEEEAATVRAPPPKRAWNTSLVARRWDPRLNPESEFRGIAWGGKLTCLCQYFHPLHFPELQQNRGTIEAAIRELAEAEDVQHAIAQLGGNCIVDFAYLGRGEPVLIIELNPFDGVCLGTFPASTGLFLWEDPKDRAVMKGEAPFEFRLREEELSDAELRSQCSPEWRKIVYGR